MTPKGLCQRCYVNILSVVHIILILLFFFINDLEILETKKTLQNDLTDKDILPLAKVVTSCYQRENTGSRPFTEVKPC